MKLKLHDLVEVHWADAWGTSGWNSPPADLLIASPVRSLGYVVQQNKEGIALAQGVSEEAGKPHGYLGYGFIPAGMITKIKKVNVKR